MKRLILIRHAKSSWKNPSSDIQRPLKKRGRNDSEIVSNHTNKLFNKPCLILSSPSKRTLETSSYFIKNWKLVNVPFVIEGKLYDFSGENLVKAINNIKVDKNTVMLFIHNYAITDFVNKFGTLAIESVPTCGFVVIDFNIKKWGELTNGVTSYRIFPKELKVDKIKYGKSEE